MSPQPGAVQTYRHDATPYSSGATAAVPQSLDLRRRRRKAGLRLVDVAADLAVHPMTVARWERRERLPGPIHVVALGAVLNMSVTEVASFFHPTTSSVPVSSVRAPGLRETRRHLAISARQVAVLLGVPVSTIYNWEKGRARLPLRHVTTLADAWGLEVDLLRAALRTVDRREHTPRLTALRRMRRHAGLSQAQVAARLGVARSSVGHWENGQPPPIFMARGLARLYDHSLTEVAAAAGITAQRELDPRTWRPGDLPNALRTLRQWSGLTQREVGRLCGSSTASVRAWENGRTVPRATARRALENLFRLGDGLLLRGYPDSTYTPPPGG